MKYILYCVYYFKGEEKPRATMLNTQTVEGERYGAKPLQTKSIKEFIKNILTLPISAL